jgi:phosphoribosylaminoimidazolecarboxamide formyltransferase / IMP cyclohydrolase
VSGRRRALVSLYRKDGAAELCRSLVTLGFEIISTGGTARHLVAEGVPVTPVDEVTGFPEMLDGRVKTLHPLLHAAILFRRDDPEHVEQALRHGVVPIDLVAVNLYPFAEAAARPAASDAEIVEMIDIGGPTLLRAAAKNHDAVTVLVDPADFDAVLDEMRRDGATSPETRRRLAARAFEHCSAYDAAIAAWLGKASGEPFPAVHREEFSRLATLRYGENPHQRAALYRRAWPPAGSIVACGVLQGKELSFNNLLDLDSAWALIAEFDEPAAVIVKHNNPCGAARSAQLGAAYIAARETDPLSAFGGVVAFNRPVDEATASEIASTFIEAVIAPGYSPAARETLAPRRSLRLLDSGGILPADVRREMQGRQVSGGLLLQDPDVEPPGTRWQLVTRREPTPDERRALEFAWKVARHVRSNAIVYAGPDCTLGIGAGQMSRVDAARIGGLKARSPLRGCALASDGFFPFRDGVDFAAAQGVRAIVQPGGSVRDEEVIGAANEAGIAMLFTGVRHFRH